MTGVGWGGGAAGVRGRCEEEVDGREGAADERRRRCRII
jgi:hypothetical protein